MSKKSVIGLVLGILTGAALVGCNSTDEANPAQSPKPAQDARPSAITGGKIVFEEPLTPTATYSIVEEEDGFYSQIVGHADKDRELIAAMQEAIRGKSFVEAHKALQSLKTAPSATPDYLVNLDERARLADLAAKPPANPQPEDAASEEAVEPPRLLAKAAASEPAWDWNADAAWFKDLVRQYDGRNPEVEYFDLNENFMGYAEKKQWGYRHYSIGMVASHVNSGRMQSWSWNCNLFGECSWGSYSQTALPPRNFAIRDYRSKSSKYNRRLRVEGSWVHLGLTYDVNSNAQPPSLPDLVPFINDFTGNYLDWGIRNSGTVTVSNPWVKLTHSPSGEVREWQMNITLAPGQSFTENNRYTGQNGSHVEIFIDNRGLIRESNEVNNITARSSSL